MASQGETVKPVILLDCDEVLSDFVSSVLQEVFVLTGTMRDRNTILGWNIAEQLNLSEWEDRCLKEQIKSEGFCAGLKLVPGAVEGVRSLREWADVRVITSPYPSPFWEFERREWLHEAFGFHRENEIIQTGGKTIVHGDVLVDDKYETIRDWSARWPMSDAILWLAPWNDHRGWTGATTTGWDDLVPYLEKILKP